MRVGISLPYRQGLAVKALLLVALCGFSCRRPVVELPVLPPTTDPLRREVIGYGVVNAAYTHVVDEPGGGGVSQGYLRQGALVRVLERRIPAGATEPWVKVEGTYEGWLPEGAIQIFDNEAQARTAVESLGR